MITLIAFLICCYITYKIFIADIFDEYFEKVGVSLFITCVIFLLTGLLILPLQDFVFKPVETGRTECKENIYSIKNVDGISGQFFLGSGQVDSSEYYYTFTKTENGGFHREKIYSSESYLFQDENKNPYMDWQEIHYRQSKWISFWPKFAFDRHTYYNIHVPANTIIEQYKIQ